MKRSVKIVIFLVTLVVVICAYFIVTKLVERADRLNASNSDEVDEIVLYEANGLSSVAWTYEGETTKFPDQRDNMVSA